MAEKLLPLQRGLVSYNNFTVEFPLDTIVQFSYFVLFNFSLLYFAVVLDLALIF